jgi:hypothetical protein
LNPKNLKPYWKTPGFEYPNILDTLGLNWEKGNYNDSFSIFKISKNFKILAIFFEFTLRKFSSQIYLEPKVWLYTSFFISHINKEINWNSSQNWWFKFQTCSQIKKTKSKNSNFHNEVSKWWGTLKKRNKAGTNHTCIVSSIDTKKMGFQKLCVHSWWGCV